VKYLNNTKLDSLRIFSLSVLLISDPYLHAASQADVRREARAALNHLYSISHAVRHLGKSAKGGARLSKHRQSRLSLLENHDPSSLADRASKDQPKHNKP